MTGGHLGPTKILMDAGLKPNVDYQVKMLGTQKRSEALRNKTIDAWGGSIADYQAYLLSDGYSESDFSILAQGSSLPNDLIVINTLLKPRLIGVYTTQLINTQDQLLKNLVTSQETQKYQGAKFVSVEDTDYNIIREIYQAMGAERLIQ